MFRTALASTKPLVRFTPVRSFQLSRSAALRRSFIAREDSKARISVPTHSQSHTHSHGGQPCSGNHQEPIHTHSHNGTPRNDHQEPVHTHSHNGTPCGGHAPQDDFKHVGQLKVEKPSLMIAFTCKKCDTRSSHVMSKQSYTSGTVLIQCPQCKVRHLIADHLKIFSDKKITIEDILSAKGESASSTPDDLAFEDIPKKLQALIGHHAKDAPKEFRREDDGEVPSIEGEKKE